MVYFFTDPYPLKIVSIPPKYTSFPEKETKFI